MRLMIGRLLWWFVAPVARAEGQAAEAFMPLPGGRRLPVRSAE